jgi:hypothetical protein
MRTIWSGHLVGTFLGYSRGLTYELSDGSKWVQDDPTHEPVYREYSTAGKEVTPESFRWTGAAIEAGVVMVCFATGMSLMRIYRVSIAMEAEKDRA